MLAGVRTPVVAIVVSLWSSGCTARSGGEGDGTSEPTACTEIGCTDGLVIAVTPMSSWPHGAYRFTIDADGTTITCTGALPLPDCGTPAMTCDAGGVGIGESGCALPDGEHAFSDIVFASSPKAVTLTVTRDDQPLATQSWTPTYVTSQPNGPDCPPTCTGARVQLALSFD